jgi:adenosylcobinamide kinase/adenosylcobinamide-phosphate guanylyltransferase
LLGYEPDVLAGAALEGVWLADVRHILLTRSSQVALPNAGAITHDPLVGPVRLSVGVATPLARTDGSYGWLIERNAATDVLFAPGPELLTSEGVSLVGGRQVISVPQLTHGLAEQVAGVGADVTVHPAGRRILVSGGARSGKSAFAERILAGHEIVEYVAPGGVRAGDDVEWAARVAKHRARRPAGWQTTETTDLAAVLTARSDADAPVLVDCLGTWLSGAMDASGLWGDESGAGAALAARIDAVLAAWRVSTADVVLVTNEVGDGVVPATASGRLFRDELGRLNAAMAGVADEVWRVTLGIPRRLR